MNAYPWVTADKRLRLPDDLTANMQPAMFLIKPTEHISQAQTFAMPSYRLQYYVFLAVRASAIPEDTSTESVLDGMLDSIEAAMMPLLGEKQTLGGLVTHAYIDGTVSIDTPVLFEQCAIWLPITVIVGA